MTRNRNKNRVFRFNRRIRGQTDYQQRLRLLKSNLPRAVIRRSNGNMLVQIISYELSGDKVLTSAKSTELTKLGFTLNRGNISSAYLTGMLAGKKALKKNLNVDVIVDLGLQEIKFGGRVFAAVKGLVDSGVKVRVAEDVFPQEERLMGDHLKDGSRKIIETTKNKIMAL